MLSETIDQLISSLEQQEIDADYGNADVDLYTGLFAAYLYKNELSHARFLWKRTPSFIKTGNVELGRLYKVFECLWHNKTAQFYTVIEFNWSPNVGKIMVELKERVQQETIKLIGSAYSSISETVFAEMTNQNEQSVQETCKSLGWQRVDGAPKQIIPKKPPLDSSSVPAAATCEDQLKKLTEFVSFLES